jgi:hypothetical protein
MYKFISLFEMTGFLRLNEIEKGIYFFLCAQFFKKSSSLYKSIKYSRKVKMDILVNPLKGKTFWELTTLTK